MIKKITKKIKLIVLSSLVISSSLAQSSLGRITFSSGGMSSNGLSITMGQSLAGSYRSADGKTILTVGAQANNYYATPPAVDELSIDKSSIIAENTKDTILINVTSNISWSVTKTDSWVTLSKSSGTNNDGFSIYLAENTTFSSRTTTITVKGNAITKVISITQKGKVNPQDELAINMLTLNTNAHALDTTIKVTSNRSWVVNNNAAWLNFKTTQGTGNADVKFTVLENKTQISRNAIVVFTAGSNSQFLSVTQEPAKSTTGINEVVIADVVKIYPNPVNTYLNVALNSQFISSAKLTIYDATGKEVNAYTAIGEMTAIDVSQLASGDYFLHVVNEQNNINHQVKFNKINE